MTTLVVGASGATGRLLVKQLIDRGQQIKVIVRSPENLPELIKNQQRVSVIRASILDLSDQELREHVKGCTAVASCLGHNLTWKGIYGQPRKLVTEAARRLSQAIMANSPIEPVKYLLMNTTGNRNRDLQEPISLAQKCVNGLLRWFLPPHLDNEQAADFLRSAIGQNHGFIQWVVVRPDSLTDEESVTKYQVHTSPTRSAIFNAGRTSRINVGHFMAELITDEKLWTKWKGQMPVIYNAEPSH